jgi:CHAD domain-containing protein
MAEALAHAHTGVAAFEGSLDDGASDETLHEVRRRVRTLRYVVELFAGAMPRRASRLIEDLRALQARLGDLHDDSAAVGRIEAWLDEGKALHDPETEAFLVRQRRARQKRRGGFFREWGVLTRGLRNRLGLQGDATPPNSV